MKAERNAATPTPERNPPNRRSAKGSDDGNPPWPAAPSHEPWVGPDGPGIVLHDDWTILGCDHGASGAVVCGKFLRCDKCGEFTPSDDLTTVATGPVRDRLVADWEAEMEYRREVAAAPPPPELEALEQTLLQHPHRRSASHDGR